MSLKLASTLLSSETYEKHHWSTHPAMLPSCLTEFNLQAKAHITTFVRRWLALRLFPSIYFTQLPLSNTVLWRNDKSHLLLIPILPHIIAQAQLLAPAACASPDCTIFASTVALLFTSPDCGMLLGRPEALEASLGRPVGIDPSTLPL